MYFLTAPLIADLFLLAITAIGRKEVHDGTVGTDHIYPIEIMAFFITLAYIAISIDASGLIRWLALKVLQKGGSAGHLLFLYLYCFFFGLASFVGNDPIVLSGTPFLAYMTRLSSNIRDPKAWIYTQFSVANIASATLVSSNPTNLLLAGAFDIKFIEYTANMIVPVIITAILFFPFLLFYMFRDDGLIPHKIEMHQLPSRERKPPANPNIPYAGGVTEEDKNPNTEEGKLLLLEEIMNPFLDKKSAVFGSVIMAITLIAILALNAASTKEHPAFWITLPAAVIMFCWDVSFGWIHRHETRKISCEGQREIERRRQEEARRNSLVQPEIGAAAQHPPPDQNGTSDSNMEISSPSEEKSTYKTVPAEESPCITSAGITRTAQGSVSTGCPLEGKSKEAHGMAGANPSPSPRDLSVSPSSEEIDDKVQANAEKETEPTTLTSLAADGRRWAQESFPTVTAVLSHLPLPLVPFGLCHFILVQALVTEGWISVFAYGWNHWVNATGTVGAIGGMGFLAVIFCNVSLGVYTLGRDPLNGMTNLSCLNQFAGTNIGTTILLCRVVQEWVKIRSLAGIPITERTFWATVYSMAVGLNYGAFSIAFSASLAGMLWRTILARKHIHVRALDFAIVNLRLVAFAMIIGCTVLIGEVYITRGESPYVSG